MNDIEVTLCSIEWTMHEHERRAVLKGKKMDDTCLGELRSNELQTRKATKSI
jgi:hypothetical protein